MEVDRGEDKLHHDRRLQVTLSKVMDSIGRVMLMVLVGLDSSAKGSRRRLGNSFGASNGNCI